MSTARNSLSNSVLDKATLLFVDDERRVLSSMRAMFRRDYHVFVADSGREALEIIDRERIDVIISDQRMPEMTGVELLCTVKERAPSIMRILLTGYADLEAIEASINEGEVFRYLMKPCPPEDLKKAIAMAVEAVREGGPRVEEIELEVLEPVEQAPSAGEAAELIPFPNSRKAQRPTATVHQLPKRRVAEGPNPVIRGNVQAAPRADVLLLSADKVLFETISNSVAGIEIHRAVSVDQALEILGKQRIGVMVTDITVDGSELEVLTKTLKSEVPELVTIIASERSDAHTLISLINEGQIYRFLLKPVSRGQCKLWLSSALRKFEELAVSEDALARYRVDNAEHLSGSGLFERAKNGLRRLRSRLRS